MPVAIVSAAALAAFATAIGFSLYLPVTSPGVYVATSLPVGVVWGKVKPWVMQGGAQFRPGSPPALSSADWARSYNEVKELGGKASTARTTAQTEAARMVSEKLAAAASLQASALSGALGTTPASVASRTVGRYRRKVRANRRRLAKG